MEAATSEATGADTSSEVIDTVWKACAYGDFEKLRSFLDADPAAVNKADEQVEQTVVLCQREACRLSGCFCVCGGSVCWESKGLMALCGTFRGILRCSGQR